MTTGSDRRENVNVRKVLRDRDAAGAESESRFEVRRWTYEGAARSEIWVSEPFSR